MSHPILTPQQLQAFVRRELGLVVPEGAIVDSEVTAESLRCALWSLSHYGEEPVYVTRWLHLARRLAGAAISNHDPNSIDSLLRDVMADLESLGDVAVLSHGYRLPAPTRTVALSNSIESTRSWLLVGGIPSHKFPETVRSLILHQGTSRLWKCDPKTLTEALGVSLPIQNESLWRGDSISTTSQLRNWVWEHLNEAKLFELESYEAEFEAYVPGTLAHNTTFKDGNHAFQLRRWTRTFATLRNSRYLVKRLNSFGMGEMRVGQISDGKLKATGSLFIENGDTRRLLYGLDLIHNSPTAILMKAVRAGTIFRLQNELPRSQNRLLLALGTLLPHKIQGSYYPRDWLIPTDRENVIRTNLMSLGIRFQTSDWT